MDVDAVMEELGEKLNEIEGLTVLPFAATSAAVVPAALIGIPPNGQYDLTYGQGMDTLRAEIVVLVARTVDLAARKALTPFISGGGSQSVRAKLGARSTRWRTCHTVKVVGFNAARITMADGKYLAAVFPVDISGSGGA